MREQHKFTVGGRTVRNLYTTKDGRPRCAHNRAPYCIARGSEVVGAFAYCAKHVADAEKALAAFRKSSPRPKIERPPSRFKLSGKSIAAYLYDGDDEGEGGLC